MHVCVTTRRIFQFKGGDIRWESVGIGLGKLQRSGVYWTAREPAAADVDASIGSGVAKPALGPAVGAAVVVAAAAGIAAVCLSTASTIAGASSSVC